MVVCDVTVWDDESDDVLDDVVALEVLVLGVVATVVDVVSSESLELDPVLVLAALLVLAAVWVAEVFVNPSRHASTPPSESIVATLSAVAALRARAPRGL